MSRPTTQIIVQIWSIFSLVHVSHGTLDGLPCHYAARCVALNGSNSMCLGVKVRYTHTSFDLANDSNTLQDIQDHLLAWSGLQGAPRCWDVIQPLLCAIYMPKCADSQIEMYRRDLCLNTREPCKVVAEANNGEWPSFLDCDKPYFTSDDSCTASTYTSMQDSNEYPCISPLVNTDNEANFYEGIEGCGMPCQNPAFTTSEHNSVHVFIAVLASFSITSSLLTLLTFIIDWKNASKYPSVIIFYINICYFMGSIGWLAQFAGPQAREDIVCKSDGTMRLSEPLIGKGGETASCTIVFIIIYYFMMAGVTWFVVLAYSWHISFKKLQTGSMEDKLKPKIAYFHILSWTLPLICAIITLSLQKVDGDSLTGICFVGYVDKYARGFLVLLPITLALVIGLIFLLQGVVRLYKIRQGSNNIRNNKATSKLTATIIRLGVFTILAFVLVILTLALHIYDFGYASLWKESFREYTICKASVKFDIRKKDETECELKARPSLFTVYLNIFLYFGSGVLMSSWVWTKASKEVWKRFLRKLFSMPTNKPVKLKSKHKMIALAFQQKQKKKNGRKLSLDFHTSHDDPLGMKMDLASVTSQEMSSAWIEAIPNLVRRRGGVALPVAGTLRRYSDSDISSIIASRRASIDSQLSEAEKVRKSRRKRDGGTHRNHRGLGRVNAADIAAFNAKRRGSSLSQASVEKMKAHLGRKMSDASTTGVSNASAHNISLDCEDLKEPYMVGSRRGSNDSSIAAGLTTTAQLEHLTLATYSMFTASSLLPNQLSNQHDDSNSKPSHHSKLQTQSSSRHSKGSSRRANRKSSGRSRQLQTPNVGYTNGALDDAEDELSDISL